MTTNKENQHAGRIVRLSAENVKKIRAVEITPHGDLVVIGGENGAGKSSILDSIQMALGGKDEIPGQPVRKGSKKAKVEIDLGDIIVRRTFTEEGGTSLVIENKDGARYPSPQAMLEKLTGKLAFDPMAFLRLDGKKQLEALRQLVGVDLSGLDKQRAETYATRTLIGREADRMMATATSLPFHPDMPEFPVSVTELSRELEEARAKNRNYASARQAAVDFEKHVAEGEKVLSEYDADIRDLEAKLAELRTMRHDHANTLQTAFAKRDEMKQTVAALVDIDTKPIMAKIAESEQINAKIRANEKRSEAVEQAKAKQAEYDKLTETIKGFDATKADLLAKANFPVAGLGFDADDVTFNGLPLSQASQAEQIRVAVAIGAALNTKLRVLLVRDGSLLDKKSLALLGDLAREKGLQVWCEVVSDGEHVQVVIEDGAVKEVREPVVV